MTFKQKYCTLADVLSHTTLMDSNCMEWKGAFNKDGYAACNAYGLFKSQALHREVFRLATGLTPEVVMHLCDNTRCVNPEHLCAGTPQLNMQDKLSKNRQARGSVNGRAKLSEDSVKSICEEKRKGRTYAEIQALFSISRATVWRVLSGKNWGHVCRS